jgi:hypothetical protein
MKFHFYQRREEPGKPAGVTVSKKPALPKGDFGITEWIWGPTVLWFVDDDEFTADERQAAYEGVMHATVIEQMETEA